MIWIYLVIECLSKSLKAPLAVEWPSASESWPKPLYEKPDWPTPTEHWPDPPVYPTNNQNKLSSLKITAVVVSVLVIASIIFGVSIIFVRRSRKNKSLEDFDDKNKSTVTENILQNEDDL